MQKETIFVERCAGQMTEISCNDLSWREGRGARGSSNDKSQRREPEFTFNELVNFPLCSVYDRDGKVRSSLLLAGRTRKSVLEIDNR